jgi:flagellar biogenesis protein FliO
VIPGTLLGLVAFAASLGPGYFFVRVAEQREPRQERSPLLEATELIVVGAVTSSIAALLVLSVGDAAGWFDTSFLAAQGWTYVLAHPGKALGGLLSILALSYVGAWASARVMYRGRPASFEATSMWYQVLKTATGPNRAFATIELRDRRLVSGYVYAYTTLPADPGRAEIALHAPISARPPYAAQPSTLPDHFLVLRADEIVYMSVQLPVSALAKALAKARGRVNPK